MQPLISVRVITYNHEKYIARCLEGILMQKTTFPFEVLIGEHSSTDSTQEIVLDYQKKYPDKISVLITPREARPMDNAVRVQQACRGKYHAFCDGDDYWIDPLKLQKQADFMETHPDVTLCGHNTFIMKESNRSARLLYEPVINEILTFDEASLIIMPQMSSRIARSEVLATLPEWRMNYWNSDRVMWLWCIHCGNYGYLDEVMSVYHKHKNSFTSSMKLSPKARYLNALHLYQEFDKATGYQHTAQIQVLIKQPKEWFHQQRWGGFYYLLHPWQLIHNLIKAYNVVKKYISS